MKIKYIIIGIGILVIVVTVWLYLIFRTVSNNVSGQEPFMEIIDKELTTTKKVVIAQNPAKAINGDYPNVLEDNTHYGIENVDIIKEIPIGTTFQIHSALLQKGSVSGTTTAYVFGSMVLDNKKYHFTYPWGEKHAFYEESPYWTFPRAFWQEEELSDRYFFKEL